MTNRPMQRLSRPAGPHHPAGGRAAVTRHLRHISPPCEAKATLNGTRRCSPQAPPETGPLRSPLVGAVQFSDLSRGKHAQAKPPILRNQSQSKRRQRQTEWFCASEFSHPISSAAKCGSSSCLMGSGMPDYGFGRCDGHHETVDFRLRKIGARQRSAIKKIEMRGYSL